MMVRREGGMSSHNRNVTEREVDVLNEDKGKQVTSVVVLIGEKWITVVLILCEWTESIASVKQGHDKT